MAVEYIHEFSTGITLERQNGLVSKGFTVGEYMNRTMEKIPQCVERAIANKLFEVSKSSQNPEPTIVGRVVLGDKAQGELDWSVVAIVATGKDDYQRQTDLYRYFLCEGAKSLWKIVDWIEDYRHKYNRWPSYNPADTKTIGQPTRHDCGRQKEPLQSSWHDFLNTKPTPIIFQSEPSYDLKNINAIAEYKAGTESQPTSWVWNAEAIENISNFLVIQAASSDAYILLEKLRKFQASQPTPALSPGVDMAGIESSIRGLIGGGNIKPEWIQTLVQAKQQNQLTEEQWEKIFNDLGAKSRSFIANIVRLLTLRAIILPKTLPDYLQYLDIQKPDQNPHQQQQISLEFQSQIRSYRNLLDSFLSEGAISVADLIGYYRRMGYVPAVAWLFDGTQSGLWLKYKTTFVSKVQEYFKNVYSPRREYEPLEKLFKEWEFELYTYSPPIYIRRQTGQKRPEKPRNITLTKWLRANSLELIVQFLFLVTFLIFVGDSEAKLYVLIFAIFSGLFRIFLGKKENYDLAIKIIVGIISFISIIAITFVSNQLIPRVAERTKPAEEAATVTTPTQREGNVSKEAIARFDETRKVIQDIVNGLSKDLSFRGKLNDQPARNIVIAALRETLDKTLDSNNQFNLQYGVVIENAGGTQQQKGNWIEAIYVYQKNKVPGLNGEGYGYILLEVLTTDALKEEIANSPLFQFPTKTSVALKQLEQIGGTPEKIKAILNNQFNYAGAMQGNPVEIKKMVKAIKAYQTEKGITGDGIIDPDGETYNKLKQDLGKN
jgi:hypothetical protein